MRPFSTAITDCLPLSVVRLSVLRLLLRVGTHNSCSCDALTGRRHGVILDTGACPYTTREHGPCWRPVLTDGEDRRPWTWPASTDGAKNIVVQCFLPCTARWRPVDVGGLSTLAVFIWDMLTGRVRGSRMGCPICGALISATPIKRSLASCLVTDIDVAESARSKL